MKKSIKDIEIENKTVILRCDFNVSVKNGKIIDDTKIVESLKTIRYILNKNAKLVILSHFGKIKSEEDKKNLSLEIVYRRLCEFLPNKIDFLPFSSNEDVKSRVESLGYGKALLLENTRFYDVPLKLESNCDEELAKFWASLGDVFINDAFGTIHRKHASNYGISNYLESGIGFLVMKELKELDLLDSPKGIFTVIMGGSKISDKIKIIEILIEKVDYLLVGGAMAFTFIKALGYDIGKSLHEEAYVDYCKKLLDTYPDKIILPVDFYGEYIKNRTVLQSVDQMTSHFCGLDIGRKTIRKFEAILKNTDTLFWNGPLGMYETFKYQKGTKKVLRYIIKHVDTTIIGGGDIVGCAKGLGLAKKLTYVSTGGGATLEYLVCKDLPGLVHIKNR